MPDLSPLMFERIQGLRRSVYNSDDYQAGIQAFLEKRKLTLKEDPEANIGDEAGRSHGCKALREEKRGPASATRCQDHRGRTRPGQLTRIRKSSLGQPAGDLRRIRCSPAYSLRRSVRSGALGDPHPPKTPRSRSCRRAPARREFAEEARGNAPRLRYEEYGQSRYLVRTTKIRLKKIAATMVNRLPTRKSSATRLVTASTAGQSGHAPRRCRHVP